MNRFKVQDRVRGTFVHQDTHEVIFTRGAVVEVLDEKYLMVKTEKWGTIRMAEAQLQPDERTGESASV